MARAWRSRVASLPVVQVFALLTALYCVAASVVSVEFASRFRPVHGLHVEGFETTTWNGRKVYEGIDATLSNELLGNRPFPDWQVYSLEWTGTLVVPETGNYRFSLSSDDGSSLQIDGVTVVENEGHDRNHAEFARVALTEGVHEVRARYFQNGGRYGLSLMWAPEGVPFQPIPATRLVPGPISYAAYRWRFAVPVAVGLAALLACAGAFAAAAPLVRRLSRTAALATIGGLIAALRRDRVALAMIVAAGAMARLLIYLTTPAVLWPDSHVYYVTTVNVLHGMWTSHDPYRTLIYPYVMAAFLKWSRAPAIGDLITVTQQELGLLSAVTFYRVARRAFTPLVALAGVLLFAVHPLQLFYEVSILTETLFTLVLAVTLWSAVRAFERPTLARAAIFGMVAVLLVLVRPVAQWFVAGVFAVGWWAVPRGRPRVVATVVALTCYTVPLAGWMTVNRHEYGFFGVSLGRGMGLYTRAFDVDRLVPPEPGGNPEMRELWALATAERWSANRVRDELNFVRGYSGARADDVMFAFALETITAHPVAFATGTARRWLIQIADPQTGVRTCPSPRGTFLCSGRAEGESLPPFPNIPPPVAPRLRAAVVAAVTTTAGRFEVVVALALVGLIGWLRWPRRNAAGALLIVTAVYFTLVPALSQWDQDRFRLPVDAVFFLFAVRGVQTLAERSATRLAASGNDEPVATA